MIISLNCFLQNTRISKCVFVLCPHFHSSNILIRNLWFYTMTICYAGIFREDKKTFFFLIFTNTVIMSFIFGLCTILDPMSQYNLIMNGIPFSWTVRLLRDYIKAFFLYVYPYSTLIFSCKKLYSKFHCISSFLEVITSSNEILTRISISLKYLNNIRIHLNLISKRHLYV